MLRAIPRGCVLLSGLFAACFVTHDVCAAEKRALLVYAGAGFRPPVEDAAAAFERSRGAHVELTFAGSGCLLAQAELAGRGDVFIPGEMHYLEKAQERGIAGEAVRIAYLAPVIAVRKGNPKEIHGLADFTRPGVRVGLGDPQSVAVGLAAERWLRATLGEGGLAAVSANVTTRALNVNELGSQLSLSAIDAAIVWDATVPLFSDLEAVVPENAREFRTLIAGSVLSMSKQPQLAAEFLAFLISEEGRGIFRARSYEPYEEESLAGVGAKKSGADTRIEADAPAAADASK
jgi:molybdate transport system substrate-binding protein